MNDQMGLFESQNNTVLPLAYRSRPNNLENFYGQLSIKKRLNSINKTNLPHIIFYGPPGCGKTTLSTILANESELEIYNFNAVLAGVAELRSLIKNVIEIKKTSGKKSIIFIDEIHRFNKSQQDALLPYLEAGDFILFGATTEYPQTTLNKAILSRVQVWPFNKLDTDSVKEIITQVLNREQKTLSKDLINHLATYSNGDARAALNNLELILSTKNYNELSFETVKRDILNQKRDYDKNSERHYDVISAFIKSVRGSDTDAAILWLAVMLDGGEDPDFIARRLIILASEDIGNADPRGLQMATSCHYAIKTIGMPEARIILAQTTTYLSSAPKSNSSYLAIDKALDTVRNSPTIEVPTHLRNHHPDKKNYKYPHSYLNHWVKQSYKEGTDTYFESSELAYEKMQKEYLDKIKREN